MLSKVRCGFLGMRKLEFMFNLRSLKNATASAKMDLGEFFTSEKITDDQRFFYECYGAWLQDKLPSNNSLKKFSKIYRKLSVDKLHEIKLIHAQSNIISKNYLEALKKTADEKKNR